MNPLILQATNAFWLAFLSAAFAAPFVFRALLATKSRQTVSQHAPDSHQVKQGTPTMGGIIILVGSLVAFVSALSTSAWEGRGYWLGATSLLIGFGLIGFVDDFVVPRLLPGKRGLGWKQKILMQLAIAVIGAWFAAPSKDVASLGLLVFVILFFSNAYNFSDGLDALAGSLLFGLTIGVLGLGLLGMMTPAMVATMVALSAAAIPFLYLNAPPAKVFMGDVGSLPVGAIFGLIVGLTSLTNNGPLDPLSKSAALVVLSIVMVAELLPPPIQIFWVKVFKKRLFPYTPIHHAFEKAGWKETRVVWAFALTQLLASVLAVSIAAR